ARPYLWDALAGPGPLREAAVSGLGALSRRADGSPEMIAEFLVQQLTRDPAAARVQPAIET
ncbi:MAG: hypothetical protein GWO24_03950, partial [Akkermansiaceae bacterium]|nr:hypothetical protein [Akkermansiaceae bacterium]